MSDPDTKTATRVLPCAGAKASVGQMFLEFPVVGISSFGGVVPYLRASLVTKQHWIDDKELVGMLSISQSLPGLNATNMAILEGDKLCGALGSLTAIVGVCLPDALIMAAVAVFYRHHGDRALVSAGLKGVAAAAVGLLLHQSVFRTLIVLGILAILFQHPRRRENVNL